MFGYARFLAAIAGASIACPPHAFAETPSLDLIVETDFGLQNSSIPLSVEFALLSDGTVFYQQQGARVGGGFRAPHYQIGHISPDEKERLIADVASALFGMEGLVTKCTLDPDACVDLCEQLRVDFPSQPCIGFKTDVATTFIRYRSPGRQEITSVGVFGFPSKASLNYYSAPDGFRAIYDILDDFTASNAQDVVVRALRVDLVALGKAAPQLAAPWPTTWPQPSGELATICAAGGSIAADDTWRALLEGYVQDRNNPENIWAVRHSSIELPSDGLMSALGLPADAEKCP